MYKQKRFWLGLVVSLALLGLIFYQTDPSKIITSLRQAQYVYLFPALALYFIGVAVRAVRWHFLLRSLKPIPMGTLFRVVVIGYMANDILPLRMGELVRAYVLGQQASVSKAATFVTILIERVFDVLTMLTFVVVASFLLSSGDAQLAGRFQVVRVVGVLVILGTVALAVLAGMPRPFERLVNVFLRWIPSASLRERAARLSHSLFEGLGVLRSPLDSFAVYALSIVAWLCETGMYVFIGVGFGITLPFTVFLLAAAFANFAAIAPSTPGYVGVFDAPIVYTITLFGAGSGVTQDLAASYTLVLHAALYFPVTLLGLYYAWRAGLSLTQMAASRPEPGTAPEPSP